MKRKGILLSILTALIIQVKLVQYVFLNDFQKKIEKIAVNERLIIPLLSPERKTSDISKQVSDAFESESKKSEAVFF
jgi:translation initiation factor 2 gamma subunit (eIF-2gamma)